MSPSAGKAAWKLKPRAFFVVVLMWKKNLQINCNARPEVINGNLPLTRASPPIHTEAQKMRTQLHAQKALNTPSAFCSLLHFFFFYSKKKKSKAAIHAGTAKEQLAARPCTAQGRQQEQVPHSSEPSVPKDAGMWDANGTQRSRPSRAPSGQGGHHHHI